MKRAAAHRGFTLMEAILALALVAMLSGGVVGFLWDLWGRRDVMMRASADAQAGSALIERIETDVLGGLAGDARAGAGVSGTATGLKLLTRGVDLPLGGQGSTVGDLQASEYRFESGVLKARRWNAGGTEPEFETVCDHVEALRLRYFDGEEWKESFDSLGTGTLPVAIEVGVWFGKPVESEGSGESHAESGGPTRRADRLRVIVVPDGPVASWKELR